MSILILFMLIQKNLKYWPFLSLRCQRSTNVTNSPWKDCCHLFIKFISPIIYVFSKKESTLKKSYQIFFVTSLSRMFLFLKDHLPLLLASLLGFQNILNNFLSIFLIMSTSFLLLFPLFLSLPLLPPRNSRIHYF